MIHVFTPLALRGRMSTVVSLVQTVDLDGHEEELD